MALTEETIFDGDFDEFGNVGVRRVTRFLRDGEVVAFSYHRHVVSPDDPLTGEDDRVRRIAVEARKGARTRPPVEEGAEPRARGTPAAPR